MRFIQFNGDSPLINGSKSSFLHIHSSWFDQKLEELVIWPNRLNMDILIRKWNNFFNLTPMRFIQFHGDSPLIISSKLSFLHIHSSWFDQKLEELAIWPNRLNMDTLIRKWNNFFNLTHMRFIQFNGDSPLINGSKSSFLHIHSSWFDQKLEELAIWPNRLNMDTLIRK